VGQYHQWYRPWAAHDGAELFGLTTPLITTADGGKMGKTASGAVWLNADQLSAYDYWQFWRNTADADVVRFLKLFTDLPLERIAELGSLEGAAINDAKVVLANEATAMLTGAKPRPAPKATARETFSGGGSGDDLPTLHVAGEIGIVAALTGLGFAASNGEARRKIVKARSASTEPWSATRAGGDGDGSAREDKPRQEEARHIDRSLAAAKQAHRGVALEQV
jgi:tyrosyl-tRNA synthetase